MTDQREKIPVVFLHGFTGSGDDWMPVMKELENVCDPVTINLVGHGTDDPPPDKVAYTIDEQVKRILSIADRVSLERFVLAGYSMGGRIALNFAVNYPERLYGLILESATAGIEDAAKRKQRIESDEELAQFIESSDIKAFVERWMNLPLFASQSRLSPEIREEIKAQKVKNSKIALVNTLRAAGTGQMKPLWHRLSGLAMPVLLITGSIDEKFTDSSRRMAKLLPDCKHEIIEDTGHNVHLENLDRYCKAVKEFISTIHERENNRNNTNEPSKPLG